MWKIEGCFWTGRRLGQGCPLNSLLFSLLVADLEEVINRVKGGGSEGRRK